MSKFNDFKNKVAEFLKVNFYDTSIAPAMAELKTVDGNIVAVDKLEPGGVITIDGVTPADGSYTLESGEVLTVANGLIGEVKAKEEEPQTPPAPPTNEEMKTPQQMKEALDKFAEGSTASPDMAKLVTIVKACFEYSFGWQLREEQERATRDAAIATYKSGFSAQEDKVKDMETKVKKFAELLTEFADTPIVDPVIKDWDKMTPLEKRRANK